MAKADVTSLKLCEVLILDKRILVRGHLLIVRVLTTSRNQAKENYATKCERKNGGHNKLFIVDPHENQERGCGWGDYHTERVNSQKIQFWGSILQNIMTSWEHYDLGQNSMQEILSVFRSKRLKRLKSWRCQRCKSNFNSNFSFLPYVL